jgi:hypothetical protein
MQQPLETRVNQIGPLYGSCRIDWLAIKELHFGPADQECRTART